MGGDGKQKLAVLGCTEKSANYEEILDCCVTSGQATEMKIVFLASSKNGDYADKISSLK